MFKTFLFVFTLYFSFASFIYSAYSPRKNIMSKGVGNTIKLGSTTVHRFKESSHLTNDDIKLYLSFIRKGGIDRNVDDTKELIRVKSGSELMRVISYNHIVAIVKKLKAQRQDTSAYETVQYREENSKIKAPVIFYKDSRTVIIKDIEPERKDTRIRFSKSLTIKLIQGNKNIRKRVIESFLGGFLNKDPRVRLFSIHVVRTLVPEATVGLWEFVNDRVEEQEYGRITGTNIRLDASYESVKKDYYNYLQMDSEKAKRIVYKELLNLRRFISRFILVRKIREGEVSVIGSINPELFNRLLGSSIDNEAYYRVPINYFGTKREVEALVAGLSNKHIDIQQACADALIRILRTSGVEFGIKTTLMKGFVDSDRWHSRVIEGFSEKDRASLTKSDIDRLTKLYLERIVLIKPCLVDEEDRYDSAYNPQGCTVPYVFEDVHVRRSELLDAGKVAEEVESPSKGEEAAKQKDPIKREYVLE